MKMKYGNERLTARRWRAIHTVSDVGLELADKRVLVLGQLPFPIRPLVTKFGVKISKVSLMTDLAVELVIERHFVEGWKITSTCFGEDALPGQWDFVIAQGDITNLGMLGQSASEILEFSTLTVRADEVLVVPSDDQRNWGNRLLKELQIDESVSPASKFAPT